MKTQTITFSKSATILKCCFIAMCIALVITACSKVTPQEFLQNIMDWDSI